MSIDPEVISSSSSQSKKSVRSYPKWAIYWLGGIGAFIAVNLVKSLIPVLIMAILIAFIWSQATKPS